MFDRMFIIKIQTKIAYMSVVYHIVTVLCPASSTSWPATTSVSASRSWATATTACRASPCPAPTTPSTSSGGQWTHRDTWHCVTLGWVSPWSRPSGRCGAWRVCRWARATWHVWHVTCRWTWGSGCTRATCCAAWSGWRSGSTTCGATTWPPPTSWSRPASRGTASHAVTNIF